MNENLIQVVNDNVFTTSLLVAEKFNKDHKNVLRIIDGLISEIEDSSILSRPNNKNFEISSKLCRFPIFENQPMLLAKIKYYLYIAWTRTLSLYWLWGLLEKRL